MYAKSNESEAHRHVQNKQRGVRSSNSKLPFSLSILYTPKPIIKPMARSHEQVHAELRSIHDVTTMRHSHLSSKYPPFLLFLIFKRRQFWIYVTAKNEWDKIHCMNVQQQEQRENKLQIQIIVRLCTLESHSFK